MASDLEGLRQAEEEVFTALFMAAQERQPIIALLYAYRDAVEARVRAEVEEERKPVPVPRFPPTETFQDRWPKGKPR